MFNKNFFIFFNEPEIKFFYIIIRGFIIKKIDDADYIKILEKVAEQKMKTLKSEKNIFIKKRKLQDFLLGKGYESRLISEEVGKIGKKWIDKFV